MASNKTSTKERDDLNKKRKREAGETDKKPKRVRKTPSQQDAQVAEAETTGKLVNGQSDALNSVQNGQSESGWRISKPMGGRMLDLDPILTDDDQYLLLAYNTSIQIYTAVDSLLVRRIPIPTLAPSAPKNTKPASIVGMRASKQSASHVWVALSDGRVFHVDWTNSSGSMDAFETQSKTAKAMNVVSVGSGKSAQDVVVVVEADKSSRMDIVAYLKTDGKPQSRNILSLKKSGSGLQLLEASSDGKVLVGALNDCLFIGSTPTYAESLQDLSYEFVSFDAPDIVTSIDLRVSKSKKAKVDIAVGGARGGIYVYKDAIAKFLSLGKQKSEKEAVQAQKYHWHRRAVHSVKWSRDGNYMISGGSEQVMVIWQMDTSQKNFLPHLSGSIENIVVSANGSSYVVHLDDNSAMIVSTAELKPTAYVSGIQSASTNAASIPKDLLVNRVWSSPANVRRPIPAAIRAHEPSKLHVCVGNGRQATMSGDFSAPLLQCFDLETFTSVSKQPLARTQPTESNITQKGAPIDEPLITHVAFSADGKWLASVDDWKPAERDVENISPDLRDQFIRERHEVYLKFWEVGADDTQAALVSRINAPHATTQPETVLDLAADPVSSGFATIGSDGMVRLWRPRVRQSQGIVAKGNDGRDLSSWSCAKVVAIGDGLGQEAAVDLVHATRIATQGSVTFSEDGSTIFAAFGGVDTGMVFVIDAVSGDIIKTLEGLWAGELKSIRALSPFLVILSNDLRVFDVVGDELRYGLDIPNIPSMQDLLLLEVDRRSRHFAVSMPMGDSSSIGIFDPEDSEPLMVRSIPHRAVSLVAAPDTSGFVVLDDSAQVWTLAEESDPSSLAAIQPLEELQLDAPVIDDEAMDSDDDEPAPEDDEMDVDEDNFPSVIAPQHLADIFNAAPPFAGPSIEEMFYKVTNLLGAKPLLAD
ncbi:uncharacterized protein F5Z01DRAFT_533253 [Emericellopsis atlantica]|uniref:Uncharacterized protein n=1 Tax=Emericellopsis atlantica TaxID=2614577 RepID=A0A9P7ZQN3_9HYPO|nr:uncharacterized protein F5Z01DRAFT_533253 [Emericellopsis atlantica]KAG9256022.1 hypothetical protein F5Z01DRAFT_533253 [Emericellopsis atlantica]